VSSVRRSLITFLFVPLLCVGALVMFVAVVCDFSVFRVRAQMAGPERPKGLWEF
jgi:hypothetical protein